MEDGHIVLLKNCTSFICFSWLVLSRIKSVILMSYNKELKLLPFHYREASNSILNFLSDVFDIANSSQGKPYVSIRDNVIIPRGAVITRILVAALTGALPSSRLETVIWISNSFDRDTTNSLQRWWQLVVILKLFLFLFCFFVHFALGNICTSNSYTSLWCKGFRVGKGGRFLNSIKCRDRGGKVKIFASFVRCSLWCRYKWSDDSHWRIVRGLPT